MSGLVQCSLCSGVTQEEELPDADTSDLEAAGMPLEVIEAMYGDHAQCPHCFNNSARENFTPVEVDDDDMTGELF
jgi:hypothetical protein